KLDILTGFKELKVCNSYKVGDKIVADFPSAIAKLAEVEPVYYSLPGWSEDGSAARAFEDLPENARKYVQHIEQVIGVPVVLIGVGPDREQLVLRGL
ncbi:adenylosuccinate synthetase, partial [Pyramidobacter piscolens]|uniref:adenylosuccinate synthetase n=1 Tax=Pyramidobacter piscolens TaxID=638849 RepID=UPI0026E04A53